MKTTLILLCAIALGMVACNEPPDTNKLTVSCPPGSTVKTRTTNEIAAKWCTNSTSGERNGEVVIVGPKQNDEIKGMYERDVKIGTWRYTDERATRNFVFVNGEVKNKIAYAKNDRGRMARVREGEVTCIAPSNNAGRPNESGWPCECVVRSYTPEGFLSDTEKTPGTNCNHELPRHVSFVEER